MLIYVRTLTTKMLKLRFITSMPKQYLQIFGAN